MTTLRAREVQCDGKVRFASKTHAKKWRLHQVSKPRHERHIDPHDLLAKNIYRCPWCRYWHFGTLSGPQAA